MNFKAALLKLYPDPGVIDVRAADDFLRRHAAGFGSVLGYLIRHRSQQAYIRDKWKGTPLPRASRRDDQGVYRGIKSPVVGKRFGITRNINARAQESHRKMLTHIRIAAERRMIAARARRPMNEDAEPHQEAA